MNQPQLFGELIPDKDIDTQNDTMPQCSKGWGNRCAISKGKKCRCRCRGHNHGAAHGRSLVEQKEGDSALYETNGYYSFGSRFDVHFIQGDVPVPVLIISQRHDNENTSVTNLIEYIAAELLGKFYPQAFEGAPVRVIEHYPAEYSRNGKFLTHEETFDEVTFASMKPERTMQFAQRGERVKLGTPSWKHLKKEEFPTLPMKGKAI